VTRRGAFRAAGAGVAAGALAGAAGVAGGRIAGFAPGPWLLAALVPAAVCFLIRLRGVRPSLLSAALLLDRTAGTRERFTAAVVARDPEVRDLAAAQALDREPFRSGGMPFRFPPSAEGLSAVVALALLGVALLLAGDGPAPAPDGAAVGRAVAPGSAHGAPGPPAAGRPAADPEPGAVGERDPAVTLAAGEDLTGEEWEALHRHGVRPAELESVRAAAARGDGEGAAAALREALRRVASAPPAAGAERGDPPVAAARPDLLDWPTWSPRFDRVVRDYFTR
jgi:hypothetical protein